MNILPAAPDATVGVAAVLLLQCRLPNSGGTWMVVEGGMGVVTQQLATALFDLHLLLLLVGTAAAAAAAVAVLPAQF
jgi:hypothetical protein